MPWCPKCGAEHRPGFDVCRDCNELLEQSEAPAARPAPARLSGPRVFGETALMGLAVCAIQVTAYVVVIGLFNAVSGEPSTRGQRLYWTIVGLIVMAAVAALSGLAYGFNRRPARLNAALPGYLAGAAASWGAWIAVQGLPSGGARAVHSVLLHTGVTVVLATAGTWLGRRYALRREARP